MHERPRENVEMLLCLDGHMQGSAQASFVSKPEAEGEFIRLCRADELDGQGTDIKDFCKKVRDELGLGVVLLLNSPGGIAVQGKVMAAFFDDDLGREKVSVYVPFLAASGAAQLFLRAGFRFTSPEALIGLHTKASLIPVGVSSDLKPWELDEETFRRAISSHRTVTPEAQSVHLAQVEGLIRGASKEGAHWLKRKLAEVNNAEARRRNPDMHITIPGRRWPSLDPTVNVMLVQALKGHGQNFLGNDPTVVQAWDAVFRRGAPR